MAHILVIDDDADIGNLLEETLTAQGYAVSRAYSGTEALLRIEAGKPDLVLLDLMLPGLSGEQLLPMIKGIPVIVVSAKIDTDNKVALLLGGAADYITKPFHTKELLARVAVQLRNRSTETAAASAFADITLSDDAPLASVCGNEVRLTRTEHAILKLLLRNPEQVVTKSAVLDQIAADTPDCTETSLKQHISNLRRKLRGAGSICNIEAVWGIGFRLHKE
ncbi:MAG: response regulator transcription factor [Oscillospiraceae bacterium]|nr:response regulator transcription factor [Oscillospiraceae bacterium]